MNIYIYIQTYTIPHHWCTSHVYHSPEMFQHPCTKDNLDHNLQGYKICSKHKSIKTRQIRNMLKIDADDNRYNTTGKVLQID